MGRRNLPSEAHDASDVEQTEVRARKARTESRVESLDAKLERARDAFEQLGDEDPRSRLLQVAMLRRDEVLLDALLSRFESNQR